ncbi:hypothetical protein NDA07_14715 [Microcoleus vaginatus DQ-U2]|uniref:hypothetical protein n=1 Tax=Microcoleus vaginatus TaxID=119532 RepID=UPI0016856066|nr:hypothetical protein [Microcoleus sp. FACHB-DQ6]
MHVLGFSVIANVVKQSQSRRTFPKSQIPNGLTQAPVCGYALKLEVALLEEEVARVAQKSSCTAQSCCEQQWTA